MPRTAIQPTGCGSSSLEQLAAARTVKPAPPRREQPLLRAAREQVDVRPARRRAAARPSPWMASTTNQTPRSRHASPEPLRGRPRSRWRIRPTTARATRTPGASSAREQRLLVEQPVARRHDAHVVPALPRCRHPRIDVRRKLAGRGRRRRRPAPSGSAHAARLIPYDGVHRQRDLPASRRSARRRARGSGRAPRTAPRARAGAARRACAGTPPARARVRSGSGPVEAVLR